MKKVSYEMAKSELREKIVSSEIGADRIVDLFDVELKNHKKNLTNDKIMTNALLLFPIIHSDIRSIDNKWKIISSNELEEMRKSIQRFLYLREFYEFYKMKVNKVTETGDGNQKKSLEQLLHPDKYPFLSWKSGDPISLDKLYYPCKFVNEYRILLITQGYLLLIRHHSLHSSFIDKFFHIYSFSVGFSLSPLFFHVSFIPLLLSPIFFPS